MPPPGFINDMPPPPRAHFLKALRAFGDCALKIDYLIEAGLNTDTVSCSEETGSELKVVVQDQLCKDKARG
jgi:hypothetical protein